MKRERTPVRLFVIAAAADAVYQEALEKHVYPLWQQGLLENWQSVQPGEQVEEAFGEAKLMLLLLSADLNADAWCQEHMQRALERQREGEVKVLPILVRPVEATDAPFARLAMVPTNGKAVTVWENQDAAWAHITEAIRCVLEDKPLPQMEEKKEEVRYRTENQQPVQGQTMGEHNIVHHHYYSGSGPSENGGKKATTGSFVDVCVVCTLAEEVEAFLRVAQRQEKVQITHEMQKKTKEESYLIPLHNVKGEVLRIHLSWPSRYGPHEMMLHAKQVMGDNQPRLAVMTGFCAADKRRVSLGDLVIAERTFFYDTGSVRKDEQGQQVHEHDVITSNMPEQLLGYVRLFQEWKPGVASLGRPVSKRGQRDWLLERLSQEQTGSLTAIPHSELEQHAPVWRKIVQELQQGPEPWLLPSLMLREKARIERLRYGVDPFPWHDPAEARCHIEALASGSAVRRDTPFQEVQIPVRGAIGIDMEGAAFGRVMQGFPKIGWLVVKGVADYADQEKDESYHAYAAEAAASYALSLIQHYVTHERLPRWEGNLPASRDGPKRVWMLPYARNPFFTGRNAVLDDLHQRFQKEQAQAVSQPQQ